MKEVVAEVVSIGSELLLGQIVDTHAATMARVLAECGITCRRRQTAGDNLGTATEAIRDALSRSDVVITISGLGPTEDDLTRPAIAAALGDTLERSPEMEARLREMFASRRIRWIESFATQADKPTSARFIENPNGSAPGLICEKDGKAVLALPGPPGEFNPMANGPVRDYLAALGGNQRIFSRLLRICGMGESMVEQAVKQFLHSSSPSVAPYAKTGEVHLRLTARAASETEALRIIEPVEQGIRGILGDKVYGVDETTLEEATVKLAIERGITFATGESVTGGWVGQRATSVPGSSTTFLGGIIAYSPEAKVRRLGVRPETLREFGPVSEEVAREMAIGAREEFGADFGVSTTGNAGPTADAGGKPVGQVYVAVAGPEGVEVQGFLWRSQREDARLRTTMMALTLLRSALLRAPIR